MGDRAEVLAEEAIEEPAGCPVCGGPAPILGIMGQRVHYRCQDCGMEFGRVATEGT